MKKLGKLSINKDKIMKNEELVNLRGGDYGECGDGFKTRYCFIKECESCSWSEIGIVCIGPGQNEQSLLEQYYPELYSHACANSGGYL